MCMSSGPARFSNTTLYVGPAMKDGVPVHVMGYQNTAQNLVPDGGANAMILPFPAKTRMDAKNVVDTKGCRNILKDIAEAAASGGRGGLLGLDGPVCFSAGEEAVVFDTGIYTVVMAVSPAAIMAALSRVPANKRPKIDPELLRAYARWYPGWQLAVCCFDNADAIDADPLLFWYEPSYPEFYFAPALDGHGEVPDLSDGVQVDHTVAFGNTKGWFNRVRYQDELTDELRALLPKGVCGRPYDAFLANGDFVMTVENAEQGMAGRIERRQPGDYAPISL